MIKYEKGFIETVEQSPALLYADTDSLYICVQDETVNKKDKNQWPTIIDKATRIADEINEEIDNQMKNVLGPRAGLDPEFQSLFFKTELVALRMMQFNVKKTYAILYFYDEGKTLEHPAIKKTGGQIKKSSTPRLSKKIFEEIYETMMRKDIESVNELKKIIYKDLYEKYLKIFKTSFDNWNFREIGLPYKYGFGKNMVKWIWGAMFYNTFFKDELRPGASMYSLYIKYNRNKLKKLLSGMDGGLYKLNLQHVHPKWDMLSVPVETGEEFYSIYKDKIDWLKKEIDLELAWDHNKDNIVDKKFLQFKTFFE